MSNRQIEELSPRECLDLLKGSHLGRLAFIDRVGVLPIIVPVNYVVHAGSVVFRTGAGTKLAAAVRGEPVAFEVDGLDELRAVGWSVVVRGHAEEVQDPAELADLQLAPPKPWAPGDKPYLVRVTQSKISGRRISTDQSWSDWWER
jgi:nitroimidazol reductase NimA-like FMN-containing flavoprotein (pyridoxamine 5'-phosphate oxidase superfamily)